MIGQSELPLYTGDDVTGEHPIAADLGIIQIKSRSHAFAGIEIQEIFRLDFEGQGQSLQLVIGLDIQDVQISFNILRAGNFTPRILFPHEAPNCCTRDFHVPPIQHFPSCTPHPFPH